MSGAEVTVSTATELMERATVVTDGAGRFVLDVRMLTVTGLGAALPRPVIVRAVVTAGMTVRDTRELPVVIDSLSRARPVIEVRLDIP